MRSFLGKFEALALSESCSASIGSVYDPTAYTGLACLLMPPKDTADDVVADILIKDTGNVLTTGARITHNGSTYLVKRLSIDGNYVRAACQQWHESV